MTTPDNSYSTILELLRSINALIFQLDADKRFCVYCGSENDGDWGECENVDCSWPRLRDAKTKTINIFGIRNDAIEPDR